MSRKLLVGLCAIVAISAVLVAALRTGVDERMRPAFRVGAPEGVGGVLVARALGEGGGNGARVVRDASGLFSIKDCCASVTRFALRADELDAALLCPDAAADLVARDPRFARLGACVLNGDVAVVRGGSTRGLIGVPRGRGRLEALTRARFGPGCDVRWMLPASLPYAYVRRVVDGVVVDALRAFDMEGERVSLCGPDNDAVTWELVARREVMVEGAFREFRVGLERAVRDLAREDLLRLELETRRGKPWTRQEVEEWNSLRVRFVMPPGASPDGSEGG